MTTEILFSTAITNDVATPKVPNTSKTDNGLLRQSIDTVTVTTGKTTGSVYPIVRIPTSARVASVHLNNNAGSASSAFDVGVYKNTTSGASADGVTIANTGSASFFGSAVACTSANTDLDVTNESGSYTADLKQMPLWQAIGLTADPGGTYDICLTNTATNAATFLAGLRVTWTV